MNVFKFSRKPAAHPCAGRLLALFILVSLLAIRIPAQTFNVTYSFNSTNDTGYNPIAPVIQGPDNTLYGTAQLGGSGGSGVVFKVQPDGTGYTVLWNFSGGNDGANPNAGLLLSGNTLYGTTYNGGSPGYGVIFAVNTDGSGFTNLYSFTGGLDCGNPYAGLILSGGTLYGTTTGESTLIQYFGSIFKINTNGSGFAVLKTFKIGDGTGANPYGGLVLSGSLLYGTTESGTPGYGTVFRLTTSGAGFTTLYSFTDGNDGGNPYGGLVLSGNELYGTTLLGGTYSSGTVFKISIFGGGFTVLYNFGSVSGDGLNPWAGLTLLGNILYGTAEYGGSYGSGTIFSLNTNGSGLTNFFNFDGTNGYSPQAALLSSGNTLYGTASGGGTLTGGTVFAVALYGLPIITNQPLSQIVPAGSTVTFSVGADGAAPLGYQWMSNNVPVFGATNTTLTLSNVSLAASGNYSVLITNTYFSIQLQAYTNSSVLSSIAMLTVVPALVTNQPLSQTVPSGSTVSFSVGVAGAAPLNYQWNSNSIVLSGATNATLTFTNVSLAASATYSVLITSSYGSVLSSNAVLTVLPASEYVSPTFLFVISSNTVSGGFWPYFLALDNSNNIYVTDPTSSFVVKFDKNGNFLTKYGNFVNTNGQFEYPGGIAIDNSNNIYVADTQNGRIEKFNSSGIYLTPWGSAGSGNGQFGGPVGVAVDSSNNVYVADSNNNRIEKFDSNGIYLTQWGTYGTRSGQFLSPRGIAVDSANNVYVADIYNNRIEKFDSDGTYLTQWGSQGIGNGEFSGPVGIAVDSSNNVYVTDSGYRVEKFTSNGSFLTQWGSAGSGNGQFNGLNGIALDSSGNYIYVCDYSNNRIQVFINNTNIIPPSITQSPANQTVAAGLTATFTVSLAGSPPFAYQWNSNNIAVPGATNAIFTLTNVSFSAAGSYSVLVSNNYGGALSDPATLTVFAELATTQPATGISAAGAVLNGSITFGPDETLAWFEWGTDTNYGDIAGVTNLPAVGGTVTIGGALNGLDGNLIYHYRVVAWNNFGLVYGNDQLFQVGVKPAVGSVFAIAQTNSAILHTTVNPNGRATSIYFTWAGNTTTPVQVESGLVATNVQIPITGLTLGTIYSYVAWASNSAGRVASPIFTFQALPWNLTTAGVQNWQNIGCSADGRKLAAAPYGGFIYTSTNAGSTWSQSTAPSANWYGFASSADGSKLVAAIGGLFPSQAPGKIYTSTNSGLVWTNTSAPLWRWNCVASSADGNQLAAVATGGGIAISTNAGVSWTTNNVTARATNWLCVATSADGNKLVVAVNQGLVYSSTNAGNTWATNNLPATNWQSVASSADGIKLVAAAGGYSSSGAAGVPGPIFTSTNAGAAWTKQTNAPNKDWFCVASSADGNKLAAVVYGVFTGFTNSIYTSTNAGVTWQVNEAPANAWEWVASSADGNKLVAGANSNHGGNGGTGQIYTFETTQSPMLNLSASTNTLVSWIIPSLDFTLEQSLDLMNWTDVTNPPVLNLTNLQNQIMLPSPNGNSFFRLQSR